LERRLLVAKCGRERFSATGPDRERLPVAAARRVDDLTVGREELGADVVKREVVGRVVRLLPGEQGAGRVGRELGRGGGADALDAVLDADASASACGGFRLEAHCRLLWSRSCLVSPIVPNVAESRLCPGSVGPTGPVLAAVLDETEDAHAPLEH